MAGSTVNSNKHKAESLSSSHMTSGLVSSLPSSWSGQRQRGWQYGKMVWLSSVRESLLIHRQNPRGISCFTAFRVVYKVKGHCRSRRRPSLHQIELPRARISAAIQANHLGIFPFLIIKDLWDRVSKFFSIMSHTANILRFMGHRVSVTTTQLCLFVQKHP